MLKHEPCRTLSHILLSGVANSMYQKTYSSTVIFNGVKYTIGLLVRTNFNANSNDDSYENVICIRINHQLDHGHYADFS